MEELRSLVIRAREGHLAAYGEVVRRFQDMAFGYAFGYAYALLGDFHLAEDAAQDAFIQAYRDLAKLDEPRAFPGWLRRMVFKCCDRLTRRKRVATVPLGSAGAIQSKSVGPPEVAEEREMADRVLDAVRSLPDEERAVTTLYYINGYSQREVAEFLEVPVTTVNNRLHSSRKQLKQRMIGMVAETLKQHALPEDFDRMIRKLVLFPRKEPRIEVSRGQDRRGTARFQEGGFLEPLEEGGKGILAWYDWPERELTGTACPRVIGKERIAGEDCFKVRVPDFDPERRWIYDHAWYYAVRDGKVYFVAKSNFEPGAEAPRLMTWHDRDWDEERTGWPIEMELTSRIEWGSEARGDGPRFPRTPVPGGVWEVGIGDAEYQCLRAVDVSYRGRRQGTTPAELAPRYRTLAEYFVRLDGRSVLMRRYNGPAWYPDSKKSSVAVLGGKGCPRLEYNGVEFRLYYDCIPLRALHPTEAAE